MKRAPALIVLAVALAATLPYLPVLGHGLVWDDAPLMERVFEITQEGAARGGALALFLSPFTLGEEAAFARGYYRPIPSLSVLVDTLLAPRSPWVWHLTNLLLHLATTLLVLALLRRMVPSLPGAAAGAVLFALHPLHVESVSSLAGRTDLWMAVFVLLSALAWLRVKQGEAPRPRLEGAASLLFLLLACLSKEPAAALPVVLAAGSLLASEGGPARWWRENRGWLAGWAGVIGVWLTFRAAALAGQEGSTPPGWRWGAEEGPDLAWRAVEVLATYLKMVFLPAPHHIFLSPPDVAITPATLGGVGLLALLFLAAFHPRDWGRGMAAAAWTAGFLLPAAFFAVGPVGAERFLFLPLVGPCIAAGWAVARWWGSRIGRWVVLALLAVAAVAAWTDVRAQLPDWRDEVSFSLAVTRQTPRLALGWNNLGSALARGGREDAALAAFDEAIRVEPGSPFAHRNRGILLGQKGRWAEAAESLGRAARLSPGSAATQLDLGEALLRAGFPQQAEAPLLRSLELDPSQARARQLLDLLRGGRPAPGGAPAEKEEMSR